MEDERTVGRKKKLDILLHVLDIAMGWTSKKSQALLTPIRGSDDERTMNGTASATAPAYADMSVTSFKPLLSKLLQHPDNYTPDDLRLALHHLASGQISHAQTGSFLAALKVTEVWRKPELVQVLVEVMHGLSGRVKVGKEGQVCDWTFTGESALSVRDGTARPSANPN